MIDAQARPATPEDAVPMTELINMAGEGIPVYIWSRMAKPGEDPWEVGRARARRESGSFSYRNTLLLEKDRQIVACLIGYPLPDQPEPIDYETMPPMFAPLQELENLACGTWYVNVLAAYPEHRGKGYGTVLLSEADRLASESGAKGLSIIVSDANTGARRLYERCGYRFVDERPIVKEQWENAGQNWVLLVKKD